MMIVGSVFERIPGYILSRTQRLDDIDAASRELRKGSQAH
jgi:hypothetical protein